MSNRLVTVASDHVRIVFPSRVGELVVVAALTLFGLGVVPALVSVAIGSVFALAWCLVAAVVLEPLVSSLQTLLRPRVDVTIGLHWIAIDQAWLGVPRRRRWGWDQIANAALYQVAGREELGIALFDAEGWPIRTAIRGTRDELTPLLTYIRERIAYTSSSRAAPPDPRHDADREALALLRSAVRPL